MNIINRSSIPLMLLPLIFCCQSFAFGQENSKSNKDQAANQKNSPDVNEALKPLYRESLITFGFGMRFGYAEGYGAATKAFEREVVVKNKDEYKRCVNAEFATRSKLAYARQAGQLQNSGLTSPTGLELAMKPFENGWEQGFWEASKDATEDIETSQAGLSVDHNANKMVTKVELAIHELAKHLGLTPGDAETAIEHVEHALSPGASTSKK